MWITDNLCIAADDVQGRANLVTHVLQEINLHTFRLLGLVTGNQQFFVLLLQFTQIAQTIHAIDKEAYEQTYNDDGGECPLQ